MNNKSIYLAGGCFWGLQELIRDQIGVVDTLAGYCGGIAKDPTYDNHPGYAESLAITYDPKLTTYEKILDYFFRIHDPTTLNQQGNDKGTSYRSAIFYQNNEELEIANKVIDKVNSSKIYKKPVVTSLEKFTKFYPAEEYHQDYLRKHPGRYTCHFLRTENSVL